MNKTGFCVPSFSAIVYRTVLDDYLSSEEGESVLSIDIVKKPCVGNLSAIPQPSNDDPKEEDDTSEDNDEEESEGENVDVPVCFEQYYSRNGWPIPY
ncbi:hypothetical protein GCM10007877_02410 [Marinibactrum halimedae]|uniref:Uncharacterized protein n=2 Tax=Marinibactrum halimedae TaxID=1444977 RepID=A0AA37WKJ2_9GAMM|nr:hypothetical protein GCM10007877_02410 [Marinibactrum halimedae]